MIDTTKVSVIAVIAVIAISVLCLFCLFVSGVSSSRRLHESIRTGDYTTFSRLLSDSNINRPRRLSVSVTLNLIHDACAATRVEFVKLMIEKHADIHAQDSSGKTCLFYAAGGDDVTSSIEICRMLVSHDSSIIQDREPVNGDSVLHYSVRIGLNARVVESLIQLGADARSVNSNGETPLDIYIDRGRKNGEVESVLQRYIDTAAFNVPLPSER